MRIGIMSMQRILNCGSYMQAFALKQMVEELGHSVEFVDFHVEPTIKERRSVKFKLQKMKQAIRNTNAAWAIINILRKRPIGFRPVIEEEHESANGRKEQFLSCYENLKFSMDSFNYRSAVDVLIIGSDEVFNCLQDGPNVGFSMELFGKNNKAKKVISYAASFGDTTLERLEKYHVTRIIRKNLKKNFDAISVRDQNSADITECLLKKECYQHLDPVLVGEVEKQEWKDTDLKDYVAVYAYANRIRSSEGEAINAFANAKNLKVISISGQQSFCDSIHCVPDEIVSYFKNASYVVTDTFHGVIFSVICHRPFAVFVREPEDESYSNANKLKDLLNKLSLNDRWAHDPDQINDILNRPIDFDRLDQIRADERKRALDYLRENIC